MKFLPIVDRELRVASRRPGTYFTRMSAAGIAMLIGGWFLLLPRFRSPSSMGTALFVALAILTFVYCFMSGVRTTADALSEEKREGTLGLLFLTDLRGLDIVLGKLFATSLNTVYGLAAVFPVMAVPLLLGGVSAAEFGRVVLSALNLMFFSLTAGLLASSISSDERKSMFMTLGILGLATGGMPLAGVLVADWLDWNQPEPILVMLSPGFPCYAAFDEIYAAMVRVGYDFFWASLVSTHVMAWVFLALACLIVPRSWRDRPATAVGERRTRWWRQKLAGTMAQRAIWRRGMLDANPVFWLTSRDCLRPIWIWGVLGLAGIFWLWGWGKYPQDWLDEATFILTAFLLHCYLKVAVGVEASRQFAHDRRSGSLEWLLCTPLTIREIVRGQWLALSRLYVAPAVLVLSLDLLFLWTDVRDAEWCLLWMTGIVVFVADLVTMGWVAMWRGLVTANTARATASTFFSVLVTPWLLFALVMSGLEFSTALSRMARSVPIPSEMAALALWAFLALSVDVVLVLYSRSRLLNRFRRLATERPGKRAKRERREAGA